MNRKEPEDDGRNKASHSSYFDAAMHQRLIQGTLPDLFSSGVYLLLLGKSNKASSCVLLNYRFNLRNDNIGSSSP